MVKTGLTMSNADRKQQKISKVAWVPISMMKVNPRAQRTLNAAWVAELTRDFNLEGMGIPVLSKRDGTYFIVDGQHRIEALRNHGLGNEILQCEVYDSLTEPEEAQLFLLLNNSKKVGEFARYNAALTEGAVWAVELKRAANTTGFVIAEGGGQWNRIAAIASLRAVYEAGGEYLVRQTLQVLAAAFPEDAAVSKAALLRGMGLVLARYRVEIKTERLVKKLSTISMGANGILRQGQNWKLKTDRGMPDCVAAAIVDAHNKGGGTGVLQSWWK